MMSRFKLCVATVVLIAGGASAAWAVQGDAIGETQTCLDLQRIDSSPAIDAKTILVKMSGPKSYKRIDLAAPCGLDSTRTFAHSTTSNNLCKQDTLKVVQEPGGFCMISQIVTISEDEAKALEKRCK